MTKTQTRRRGLDTVVFTFTCKFHRNAGSLDRRVISLLPVRRSNKRPSSYKFQREKQRRRVASSRRCIRLCSIVNINKRVFDYSANATRLTRRFARHRGESIKRFEKVYEFRFGLYKSPFWLEARRYYVARRKLTIFSYARILYV